MTSNQKIILYADDDPDDREFLVNAIRKSNPDVLVIEAENGLAALDYLKEVKQRNDRLPCLIVLDINMPFLDGKATFQRLKNDETLSRVPVIVFSSSEKPQDKDLFRQMGIEYFTKPTNISNLSSIAEHMVSVCC